MSSRCNLPLSYTESRALVQEFVKHNTRLAEIERRFGFGEHGGEQPKEPAAPK